MKRDETGSASVGPTRPRRMSRVYASLAACMFAGGVTGAAYGFGVYSRAIKLHFGMMQMADLVIPTASTSMGLLTFAAGALHDWRGPRFSTLVGGCGMVIGLCASFLCCALVPADRPWTACVSLAASGAFTYLCGGAVTAAVFAATCANFPGRRGTMVGIVKSWVGLCSGFTTQLFMNMVPSAILADDAPEAAYAWDTTYYLLFMSVATFLGTVPVSYFLSMDPEVEVEPAAVGAAAPLLSVATGVVAGDRSDQDPTGESSAVLCTAPSCRASCHVPSVQVAWCYADVSLMAVVVTISALMPPTRAPERTAVAVAIVLLWIVPPLVLPFLPTKVDSLWCGHRAAARGEGEAARKYQHHQRGGRGGRGTVACLLRPEERGGVAEAATSAAMLLTAVPTVVLKNGAAEASGGEGGGGGVPSLSTPQMLCTLRCWALLFIGSVNIGAGYIFTSNMAQISGALGLAPYAATCVTMFSVAQSAGRAIAGVLSDMAVRRGVPRPGCFAASSTLLVAAHLVAIDATLSRLLVAVVLCGLGFGSQWPLMVVVVNEVFGPRHFGSNYMFFDGVSAAIGNIGLAMLVSQSVYQAHVGGGGSGGDGQGGSTGGSAVVLPKPLAATAAVKNMCLGDLCYRDTHLVAVGLLCAAALVAVVLTRWTRPLYAKS